MRKQNDCIAQSIAHALRHFSALPSSDLVINDLPDLALPYALLPQIACHYGLYVTEVPRSLPLSLLDPSCFFIIVTASPPSLSASHHVITSHNNVHYCPQTNSYIPPSELVGRVLAIYLCQPSLNLGTAYALALGAPL